MILEKIRLAIKDLVYSTRKYKKEDIDNILGFVLGRIHDNCGFPKCPLCGCEMKFRWSRLSYPPYRDDVAFKCVKCFHTNHRGYPISKQQFLIEVNLRQGRTFMNPTFETGRELIKHRLKELGYIEFE